MCPNPLIYKMVQQMKLPLQPTSLTSEVRVWATVVDVSAKKERAWREIVEE